MFYKAVVTVPKLRLEALISLIEKIQVQAKEKGIEDHVILEARLAPDMFTFARQVQIVSDAAKGNAAKLSRKESPKMEDTEVTLDELKVRLQKTLDYLATFTEADFANAATAEIRYDFMPGKKMVGE
jgi:hypothetical protein